MTLRIATNLAAQNAAQQFELNYGAAQAAAAHLSTGLRIVTAADDAAGLTIAGHLTAQINGLTQATANAQDARAVAGIADGALGTVQDALQRMRRLVLAAANTGGNTTDAVMAYSREVGALTELLDAIAEFTHSGGTPLLDGSYAAIFQVGADGGNTVVLDLSRADVHAANLGGGTTGGGIDLTRLGILGLDAADSGIYTVEGARGDLSMLTDSIVATTTQRARIGAVTNQLDYTLANLQVALGNTVGARSNLIDADMADEASRYVRTQIQATAAAAVLAQANSAPTAVLRLLDDARASAETAQSRRGNASRGSAPGSPGGAGASDDRPAHVTSRDDRPTAGAASAAAPAVPADGAPPSAPSTPAAPKDSSAA